MFYLLKVLAVIAWALAVIAWLWFCAAVVLPAALGLAGEDDARERVLGYHPMREVLGIDCGHGGGE